MKHVIKTALAATLLLATTPLAPARSAGEVPTPMCHGKRSTVVGSPGHPAQGTPRADVIVSAGAAVHARGGDDLICVSGTHVHVDAGAGDDRIDARRAVGTTATLGPGNDSYLGGAGSDTVHASGDGSDHVFTLGGRDVVDAGSPDGGADHDVVRLGPGRDMIEGDEDPSSSYYGDAGRDTFGIPFGQHDWDVDVPGHRLLRDGRVVERFTGFEDFYWPEDYYGELSVRSFRFEGGPEDDTLFLDVVFDKLTRIDTGAGDDVVQLLTSDDRHRGSGDFFHIDGGPGRDRFEASGGCGGSCETESSPALRVDLATHDLAIAQCLPDKACPNVAPHRIGSVSGIEDVLASFFDRAELTGDGSDNRLSAPNSCSSRLSGGAGDDVLDAGAGQATPCPSASDASSTGSVQSGGPGADTLIGSSADDHLTGGPGTDSADGADGNDTCDAETTTRCES